MKVWEEIWYLIFSSTKKLTKLKIHWKQRHTTNPETHLVLEFCDFFGVKYSCVYEFMTKLNMKP